MKFSSILSILVVSLWLCACSYASRLEHGIYTGPQATSKVPARVLLVTQPIAQPQFVFKDYHEKSSVHSYKIDLTNGSLIAAADALHTFFEKVDVDSSSKISAYDYWAQLDYQVSNQRTDSTESVQWLGYSQIPMLQTRVTITLFKSSGEVIFTGYAQRSNRVELNNQTAVAQRLETSGTTALLPLTAPFYTQTMGDSLRYTLERDLNECLQEIMRSLQAAWDNL